MASETQICVEYAPWLAPKTLSPILNFEEEEEEGVRRIVPANSEPAIHGKGGWCWYLPRIWRRSKKFVPAALMEIRYWVGEGVGVGREVTASSCGP